MIRAQLNPNTLRHLDHSQPHIPKGPDGRVHHDRHGNPVHFNRHGEALQNNRHGHPTQRLHHHKHHSEHLETPSPRPTVSDADLLNMLNAV